MSRTILLWTGLTVASTLWAAPLDAQSPSVEVGVTGGVSIADLVGDPEDAESRTSPYFGATLILLPEGSRIGVQTGALYVPKGADRLIAQLDRSLRLSYIEIPLLLRGALDLNSSVTPVILFGGSLGLQVACEVVTSSGGVTVAADCEDSAFGGAATFKTVDLGISAGAGLDIVLGQRTFLSPTARYTRGLIDIPETTDEEVKNSAIQVGVTLRLVLR